MNAYRNVFIRNNIFVLSGQLLCSTQNIILIPLIIKTVGVTIYGGYTLLNSLVGFIYGIASFGVGFKRSRYLPSTQSKNERCYLFYPAIIFHFVSLSILSLCFILFYSFFEKAFLRGAITFTPWLIIPYFISYILYSHSTDYFRYTHRINYYTYSTVSYPYIIIGSIFLFYFTNNDLNVNILFCSQIAGALLASAPLVYKMIDEIGINVKSLDLSGIVDDIRLGFPIMLGFIIDVILNSSDRYLISYFISLTDVGYYVPAYALGSLIVFIPKVSGVVLPPLICKSFDLGHKAEANDMLNYTLRIFLILAIPYIMGSFIMRKQLLLLIANIEVAQHAQYVVSLIAIGSLFYGLNLILSTILFVKIKTILILKLNLIISVINIIFNIILLYLFKNIITAAIVNILCFLVGFIFIKHVISSEWPLSFNFRMVFKPILASIVMGVVLYFLKTEFLVEYNYLNIICQIFIGIIVYFLSLVIMRAFSTEEIIFIRNFLHETRMTVFRHKG